jgi:hypothetical protein
MISDDASLPARRTAHLPARRAGEAMPATVAALAEIPEEEIWLAKQKSARTRRAYRLDVEHFLRTLAIGSAAELRQADHRAVQSDRSLLQGKIRGSDAK